MLNLMMMLIVIRMRLPIAREFEHLVGLLIRLRSVLSRLELEENGFIGGAACIMILEQCMRV